MRKRPPCAFVACCTFVACTHAPPDAPVHADHPNIRYTGWFDKRSARAVRFAWPGTNIAAQFSGTSIRVQMTDTPVEDDTRETDWLTVVIDGQKPRTLGLGEGLHTYALARDLSAGPHRILIWKRTEAEVGTITFYGFVLDRKASLLPLPPAPARRMVFVGDSTVAGYGNEGPDGACHWSATRENNYETYGACAARELHAEYVAAAWSGKGLLRNYEVRDRLTLPELYDRVIPTEDASPRVGNDLADVVVVNLGTNDFFRGVPDESKFIAAYQALIDSLRRRYPRALLVLGVGPMLADDYPQPQARTLMRNWVGTVRDRRRSSGDDNIEVIEFWIDPAEGVGCDFHPNVKTHARLGRELADLVRARLAW